MFPAVYLGVMTGTPEALLNREDEVNTLQLVTQRTQGSHFMELAYPELSH